MLPRPTKPRETGSFTKAADARGLAQPSLSEQVRLLERGLSATLFQRAGRLYDHFAIVHRPDAVLSRPVQSVIEMATTLMRERCGGAPP